MREIQDLTLQRDRSLEKIDSVFEKRKKEFETTISSSGNALGIRSTLIPIGSDLYIDHVHKNPELIPFSDPVTSTSGTSTAQIFYPFYSQPPRPILRGTQYLYDNDNYIVKKEIHCSGLIEFSILHKGRESEKLVIVPEWFLGLAVNSMITAHRFRCVAGARDCEYGMELELFRSGGQLLIHGYTDRSLFAQRGAMEKNPLMFPRFSMGTSSEIPKLVEKIRLDFYDSAGINRRDDVFRVSISQDLLD